MKPRAIALILNRASHNSYDEIFLSATCPKYKINSYLDRLNDIIKNISKLRSFNTDKTQQATTKIRAETVFKDYLLGKGEHFFL